MSELPVWASDKFLTKTLVGLMGNGQSIAVCKTCWSMVDIADVKMHDKWHQGETYIDPEK
jgi:hypothetical protein